MPEGKGGEFFIKHGREGTSSKSTTPHGKKSSSFKLCDIVRSVASRFCYKTEF